MFGRTWTAIPQVRSMSRLFILFSALFFARFALPAEPVDHWAFNTPRRPALPKIRDQAWPANPVDYFTLAEMESHSLSPSPRADRATQLRRLSFDLSGLPPTIDELNAYIFATAADAYDRQVLRLLDSPRFGERIAVPWLDAARYADTHGFLIDAHRDMWRWRDWVIDAFNRNLRFDQFTIEQLAGDLLPKPSLDQLIATGFNRNHMINYENGADEEEYRVEYVADRAATTANVWMGLTFQCARCHDHKYDPLSLREYYQWFAFFNSVDEQGLDGNLGNAAPLLIAPTLEQQRQLEQIAKRLANVESTLDQKRRVASSQIASWEQSLLANRPIVAEPKDPVFRVDFRQQDQLASGTDIQNMAVEVHGELNLQERGRDRAMIFDGQTFVDLKQVRWPAAHRGITIAAWVFPTTADQMSVVSLLDGRQKSRFSFGLENSRPTLRVSVGEESLAISSAAVKIGGRWQHIAVVWDGTVAGEIQWFVDGTAVSSNAGMRPVALPQSSPGHWRVGSDGEQDGEVGRNGFRGMLDEVCIFARELPAAEVATLANADPVQTALAVPAAKRTPQDIQLMCDAYLQQHDANYRKLRAEVDALKRQQGDSRRTIPTTMVMRELSQPRETFVLARGKFDRPGESVEPAVPSALPSFPDEREFPRNRLGLARWLVEPTHPLTARVMVNRLWQLFFGSGLVGTPEDFGLRGEAPSHPQLLDWLAVEFVESGWDVKHMVRLIVTSETYRQSNRVTPELLTADPENRWLTRSPRLRLEAEALRDSMLFVSGLLNQQVGGKSVFPYQPPGLWEEVSFNPNDFSAQTYVQSHGRDLYRRSMYTFWKRTLPPPALAIFDAPTRETCLDARTRTNTPLQALVLMNETTAIESARHLAGRAMLESGPSPVARVAFLVKLVLSRNTTLGEQDELLRLFDRQRTRFQANPAAARQLLATGESPQDARLDPVEQAAWTIVSNVLLSLDEAITRN